MQYLPYQQPLPVAFAKPCVMNPVMMGPTVGKALLPQIRLQAVHPLPYSPSLVPLPKLSLLHGPSFPSMSGQVTIDAPLPVIGVDIEPWINAASEFVMNADFDVSSATRTCRMDLKNLMTTMKDLSTGKRTIQALADKIVLNKILSNMNVPQMQPLLIVEGNVNLKDVQNFVHNYLCSPENKDVVIKPTHLSNGTGVIVCSRPKPEEVQPTIDLLYSHMQHFLREKAGAHESVAMRSLKAGFIAQPKYKSCVGFKTPLELRVIVLWGKARLALWWWGRGSATEEFPQRNAWLIRHPSKDGELTDGDEWEVIHEHAGNNPGFDKAVELFRAHISAVAACAEAIAVAVGAPFLRSDFFVGSPQFGVRLNEVAYGCGVEYRSQTEDGRTVDDAPAIARILQEGMAQCRKRYPSEHFLTKLGVKGHTYADMTVTPLPARLRAPLPASAQGLGVESTDECMVPEELCRTMHLPMCWGLGRGMQARRCHSWYEGASNARGFQSPAWPYPRASSFNFRFA